jgi:hypothetical protein
MKYRVFLPNCYQNSKRMGFNLPVAELVKSGALSVLFEATLRHIKLTLARLPAIK